KLFLVMIALTTAIITLNVTTAQVLPVFRIGVLDEVDGALTRGAQLAVQEINDSGGVVGADGTTFQLQLVVQSPEDMDFALANIEAASVIAVIGPADSETVLGNRDALTQLGVPILTTATDDTILANDATDLIMRLRSQEALIGRALADYLVNELNASTTATVQLDLASTVGVISFRRAATNLGLTPSNEYLLSDEITLEDIALEIAGAQTEYVVTYGPPEQVADLYTLLREDDWGGRFVYNQAREEGFRDNVQESLLEGVIGANTWSYTYGEPNSLAFTYAYLSAYGEVPTSLDAAAYDGIYLLREAIGQAGSLQNNLLAIQSYEGVQGDLTPATLARGEFSAQTVVTQLGEFGAPVAVARYDGANPVELNEPIFVDVTATPLMPTATATPDGVFIVINRPVQNVRTGPGLNYDILGQLQEGDSAEVIGANIDLTWVVINFRGTQGWLSRGILDLFGDENTIPVIAAPPTPTPPPTSTPLPVTPTPTAPPVADIVITAATPQRVIIGTPFTVTVTVNNQGSVNAGPFAVAASFEPGEIFSAQNLTGLNAGTSTTITLTGTLSGDTGLQRVSIIADLNNQVAEGTAGEANNSSFIFNYVADDPLLTTAPATGATTLNETGVATLDGGTNDIQWGGGGLVPLGA
ncbi:MAG: ABC transporter substrate-binding protein, partial [Chloroflexota bacterium]